MLIFSDDSFYSLFYVHLQKRFQKNSFISTFSMIRDASEFQYFLDSRVSLQYKIKINHEKLWIDN